MFRGRKGNVNKYLEDWRISTDRKYSKPDFLLESHIRKVLTNNI